MFQRKSVRGMRTKHIHPSCGSFSFCKVAQWAKALQIASQLCSPLPGFLGRNQGSLGVVLFALTESIGQEAKKRPGSPRASQQVHTHTHTPALPPLNHPSRNKNTLDSLLWRSLGRRRHKGAGWQDHTTQGGQGRGRKCTYGKGHVVGKELLFSSF